MSELCGGDSQFEQNLYRLLTLDFKIIKDFKVSSIGPNGAQAVYSSNPEIVEAAKSIDKKLGYRFSLLKSKYTRYLEPHQNFELFFEIENSGSDLTFLNMFEFEIQFVSENGNPITVPMVDDLFNITDFNHHNLKVEISYPAYQLPINRYKVFLRLYDRRNPKRSIRFANVDTDENGLIQVAEFDIIDPKVPGQ